MNSNLTFGVRYIVRMKSKKTDMAGIYLRITVNNQATDISTKLKCPIHLWDNEKSCVKSNGSFNHRYVNNNLSRIRTKIETIYQELRIKKELITPLIIKNHFLGKIEGEHTLLLLLKKHYTHFSASLNKQTMLHYETTYRYLRSFLETVKQIDDIYLRELDYNFVCDYEVFLRSPLLNLNNRKLLSHNTVMKHLSRFRAILNFGLKLDMMENYPFKHYKLNYTDSGVKYLIDTELSAIEQYEFSIERLSFTRDLFIFSCYTGLSFSDVIKLSANNIVKGIDGENWIYTTRKKTNTVVRIPLLPIAEQMIDKYKDSPVSIHLDRIFPSFSNQKLNAYLKEIADVCQINKNLTFHMARHTFATTVTLSNGVPIETVSKILGHHKISTTQIYAKVVEHKLGEDMDALRTKLSERDSGIKQNKSG